MFLSTLKRGAALTVSTMLVTSIAANATTVTPRNVERPAAQAQPHTVKPGAEQVLIEGGTLAGNYFGNIADIIGSPIACTTIAGDERDCAAESNLPATFPTNPQILYAAVGTGGAQLDFVNQASGFAQKTASTYPEFADSFDAYSNVSPFGFLPWSGVAKSTTTEDSIDAGEGDAPIPLGPSEGTDFVPAGFSIYADSIAAYDGNGDTNGSGFNANRGPARVVPVIATGVSIIFNTTGLTVPSGGLNLTQNDLCGIFTGVYTNWDQTSANPGNQAITLIHRSDGSGTSFLTSYDLSEMCGANNPYHGAGHPTSATYWNQLGFTQGVGTDSNVLSTSGVVPTDSSAPEVVWPNASVGASKTSGVIAAVAATTGSIGYVSPSNVLGTNTAEANIENYTGAYEIANSTTVAASFAGTTSSDPNPAGYPVDNKTTTLYFPYPTAAGGDALVGYSYAYLYTCYPKRDANQVTGMKDLFGYASNSKTSATAAQVAAFWNLNGLNATELKNLNAAIAVKTAAVTTPTNYISPVNGATLKYTCTDN